MKPILFILILIVLTIDFLRIEFDSKKVVFIYLFILLLALFVAITNQYDLITINPLEAAIDKLQPLNDWVETKFN